MSHQVSFSQPGRFSTMKSRPSIPDEQAPGALDADAVARLLAAAADVALVIDRDGVVRAATFRSASLEADLGGAQAVVGRAWSDTVSAESRPKVSALLEAALAGDAPRLRHLNHPGVAAGRPGAGDVAVEYSVTQAGPADGLVAFGRDLRPLVGLQQRLIDAQQTMERDYAGLRQAQTRYRILFETSPEPLMVLDAHSLKVSESNPAGRRLAGTRRAQGWLFPELFEPHDRGAVLRVLAAIKTGGRAEPVRVRLAEPVVSLDGRAEPAGAADGDVSLSASLLIEGDSSVLLVRVMPGAVASGTTLVSEVSERLLQALEQAPDAFVATDGEGTILAANAAFLTMTQLSVVEQAQGRALGTWLGRAGVDVDVLLANLRQRGSVRLFATTLRGEHGMLTEVEISAVAVLGGAQPSFGFAIRDVARRLTAAAAAVPEVRAAVVPRSVEQLTELIGRVSLKELVRDATDVIERLCIEAALELAENNRASAAEMLGVSRQSLYAKLHRYGLGDLPEPGSGWEGE
ncbi:MAG: transcriptional regulator PpsR [Janthinobacterium lividum]